MNWFKKAQITEFGIETEWFREPLRAYIKRMFIPKGQPALLPEALYELIESVLNKVIDMPVNIEYTDDPTYNPSGTFHSDTMSIDIESVNPERIRKDSARGGYTSYVNSVLFHEMIHAVDYIYEVWKEVDYNGIMLDEQYYGHPAERRAYYAMMVDFLENFLGIPKHRVMGMMSKFTTETNPNRGKWMEQIRNKEEIS
jgi:hypothetical protein